MPSYLSEFCLWCNINQVKWFTPKNGIKTNFCYKNARAILSLKKSFEMNVKKRKIFKDRCTKYINSLNTNSFTSSNVYPNLPQHWTVLTCSKPNQTMRGTELALFPSQIGGYLEQVDIYDRIIRPRCQEIYVIVHLTFLVLMNGNKGDYL